MTCKTERVDRLIDSDGIHQIYIFTFDWVSHQVQKRLLETVQYKVLILIISKFLTGTLLTCSTPFDVKPDKEKYKSHEVHNFFFLFSKTKT